jgi:hypothetical protein
VSERRWLSVEMGVSSVMGIPETHLQLFAEVGKFYRPLEVALCNYSYHLLELETCQAGGPAVYHPRSSIPVLAATRYTSELQVLVLV